MPVSAPEGMRAIDIVVAVDVSEAAALGQDTFVNKPKRRLQVQVASDDQRPRSALQARPNNRFVVAVGISDDNDSMHRTLR